MFIQITITKVDADTFKIVFFNERGVVYTELIPDITDIIAMCRPSLENMTHIKPEPGRYPVETPIAKP